MKLKQFLLISLSLLNLVDGAAFIPGRGCGIVTPITFADSYEDVKDGGTCVLVKDQQSFARHALEEPSEEMLEKGFKSSQFACNARFSNLNVRVSITGVQTRMNCASEIQI